MEKNQTFFLEGEFPCFQQKFFTERVIPRVPLAVVLHGKEILLSPYGKRGKEKKKGIR